MADFTLTATVKPEVDTKDLQKQLDKSSITVGGDSKLMKEVLSVEEDQLKVQTEILEELEMMNEPSTFGEDDAGRGRGGGGGAIGGAIGAFGVSIGLLLAQKAFNAIKNNFPSGNIIPDGVVNGFKQLIPTIKPLSGILSRVRKSSGSFFQAIDDFGGKLKTVGGDIDSVFKQIGRGITNFSDDVLGLRPMISSAGDDVMGGLRSIISDVGKSARNIARTIVQGIENLSIPRLDKFFRKSWVNFIDKFIKEGKKLPKPISDIAEAFGKMSAGKVVNMLPNALNRVGNALGGLFKTISRIGGLANIALPSAILGSSGQRVAEGRGQGPLDAFVKRLLGGRPNDRNQAFTGRTATASTSSSIGAANYNTTVNNEITVDERRLKEELRRVADESAREAVRDLENNFGSRSSGGRIR